MAEISYLQSLVSPRAGINAILRIQQSFKGYVGRCVQGRNKGLFLTQAAGMQWTSGVDGNF